MTDIDHGDGESGNYACPDCEWGGDEFYAYCPECGARTEPDIEPENPSDTKTDRI